jgi:uncharacterized SAM-binding protein YcdF (DUF218 family)
MEEMVIFADSSSRLQMTNGRTPFFAANVDPSLAFRQLDRVLRRIFRLLFQIGSALLAFVLVTVAWIIFDGLDDQGEKADVALVTSRNDFDSNGDRTWLDHVANRFKDGDFGAIIITTAGSRGTEDEVINMRKYLEDHGVPSKAILEVTGASDTWSMASDVAGIMRSHEFASVMIVTNYYRMTRLELALKHAGVTQIAKSHVGSVHLTDSWSIAGEVFSLYAYVGKTFLLPAAEKIKQEAKTEADKAGVEAEKAKDTVNRNLDSLPK